MKVKHLGFAGNIPNGQFGIENVFFWANLSYSNFRHAITKSIDIIKSDLMNLTPYRLLNSTEVSDLGKDVSDGTDAQFFLQPGTTMNGKKYV